LKNRLPTNALYYATRVFASKKTKQNVTQLRDAVNQCEEIATKFEFFISNEWVQDAASINKLMLFVKNQGGAA